MIASDQQYDYGMELTKQMNVSRQIELTKDNEREILLHKKIELISLNLFYLPEYIIFLKYTTMIVKVWL